MKHKHEKPACCIPRSGAVGPALATRALLCAVFLMGLPALSAWAQSADAVIAAARKDPEIADHFGLVAQPQVTIGTYGGRLTIAANIVSSFGPHPVNPGELNKIASENNLFSPNIYGTKMLLRDKDFIELIKIASDGTLLLTHVARIIGHIPIKELHEAEASAKQYIILGVFDHAPVVVNGLTWSAEGELTSIAVSNPIGADSKHVIPLKAQSTFDPALIDRWDFYVVNHAKE